ncbi:hypothetical protein FJTKL_01756 [Diaporthe vaccinii]|uniref:PNPLA domain-containing protein n=1 Tax=Diaporthe vaccinii TaxID=105482 RepID=A0ABR4F467_9PEZI
MSAAPTRPLRILVLDGGGIKGYTSLLILQRIFRMLKDKAGNQLTEQPKPCDVFDLIVGTSTGGLIAVMLGRLHMTIEEAIKQYETVGEKVFGKPTYGKVGLAARGIVGRPLYSIETLQECIKDAIGTRVPVVPPDALFCEERDPGCKVMLCVTRKRTYTPDVLRNYATNAPTKENYECQIWEATSATAAAPIYFKPVELRKRREKWVDGGLKRNNPINVAMEEVSRLQKSSFKDREIGCVVSIGTGAPQITGVSSNLVGFLAGAVEMMTDSEDIAEQFANSSEGIRLTSANRYFRFNVPQGMQDLQLDDWRETEKMRALTASYLRKNTSGVETERCAEVLLSPDVNSQSLDGDG